MGETSESAALRIVPLIKTTIPITALLLVLQGTATYLRAILQVIRGEEV
jgi:TRAP-type mannitol/chloroaromatic compound transport system permease small subunit